MKASLPMSALHFLLLIAFAGAQEVARGEGAGVAIQEDNQVQKEKPRSQNAEEEFKFRYKRPKQRHDDDEAPVPKFGKSPPAASESVAPPVPDRN